MSETILTPPTPPTARAGEDRPHPRKSRVPIVAAVSIVLVAAIAVAWWSMRREETTADSPGPRPGADGASRESRGIMRVEVTRPRRGGLGRTVVQPGVVHAFNKADLYAKVSGYLVRQRVDIGDTVKKGDVLAEIDIPELFKGADQLRAALGQAKAKQKQAGARVLTANADRDSAAAQLQQAEAEVARFTADRVYRKKELDRISALAERKAIAAELVDEQQQQYDAALAAERAGTAAVATSRAQLAAATARVAQAQADAEGAAADVEAAAADLDRAEVMLDYTRITSPYDGVITLRSFHDGDFIESRADGGTIPVLAVARNDLMRAVILVPDLDVPYVQRGDPATIRIDALPGHSFAGKIARFASSEDAMKLMRTEVDLPNPDNLLRDGMYGSATLNLEPPSNNLTIPSSSLVEQDGQGQGAVYIVRAGKAHRVPIQVDVDNGRDVEVVTGLDPDDEVVVRYNGTIAEGLAVQTEPFKGR